MKERSSQVVFFWISKSFLLHLPLSSPGSRRGPAGGRRGMGEGGGPGEWEGGKRRGEGVISWPLYFLTYRALVTFL